MIQHPIPQNVTGYQFHLIGDMTIKQFVFLSAGVGAAIAFYYTNLFLPIKWLFVIISAVGGFALAFLPFEERPLDQWLINYIRAIYRPTRFIWRKKPTIPGYLNFTPNQTISATDSGEMMRAAATRRQQGLHSYLITLPSDQGDSAIDTAESTALSRTLGLFAPIDNFSPSASTASPVPDEPSWETPVTPHTPPHHDPPPISSPVISSSTPSVPTPPPAAAPTGAQPSSDTFTPESRDVPTVTAASNSSLPFPSAPTSPNTLVGMVLDASNKIVEGAIVEVIDEAGLPVRATKTNQLGQFFSTTPLKRGSYHLTVEKSGLTFDTIKIVLTGQVVGPLKISAKNH